ncbi:protein THEM6-like isoform X2 [Agrilus planipennis]|uniref:Protein THEM6 n=1 Tax=Agrilus planipennis TaxID=224129 RepID=A0A7F5RIC8_AGRPL|nr:protein THEM6-like isoform X2 [Agrilus planipennis]
MPGQLLKVGKGYCFTNDLDIMFLHMNNARYVRELDFARFHFYDRTGLYKKIVDGKGTVVQSACSIRYRRPISIFTPFTVTTKIIDWDDRNIYIQQNFITISDNFIRATVLSRQTVNGPNVQEIMESLIDEDSPFKPNPSLELKHWKACLEESSNSLKKKD